MPSKTQQEPSLALHALENSSWWIGLTSACLLPHRRQVPAFPFFFFFFLILATEAKLRRRAKKREAYLAKLTAEGKYDPAHPTTPDPER